MTGANPPTDGGEEPGMRFTGLRSITAFTLASLAAIGACSSGGGDGTSPTTNTGSISIALSASTLTVTPGANGSVTVTVTRAGGFSGDVGVAVEGLPTGVTASSITIPGAQNVGSLTFTAAATAAAATTPLTIRATGSGVTAATAQLSLSVSATATGSFTIAAAPTSLSIAQGAQGTSTITITRTAPFTGAVNLAVTGAPAGLTPTLATSIAAGSTTATLTVAAGATLAAGSYNLTITGSGTGVSNQTATVGVTVTAAASGSFTIAAAPTSLSVAQNAQGTSTITITRVAPFTGTVNFSVTGAATGVTATLSSSAVTGTTTTLTVAAGASATVGTSNLTITATGTGVTNQTLTFPVTITSAGGGGGSPTTGNVTWKFCGNSGLPVFVAAQDGQGAWSRVIGNSGNDTFSFQITSRGSVAYITQSGTGFDWQIYSGLLAELQARGNSLCFGTVGAGKTVTAPVLGLGAQDLMLGALGYAAPTTTSGTATFSNVLSGNVDLVVGRSAFTFNGTSVSYSLNKMVIRRGLNPAAGSALSSINFDTEGFTPTSTTATITGANGESTILSGAYTTSNNTLATYFTDAASLSAATTRTFPAVPAGSQSAGDLHLLLASAIASISGGATDTRTSGIYFAAAANKTVALGPALSTPTVTVIGTTGYARLRATWAQQPADYGRAFTANFQQTGANARAVTMQQTADFAGNTTTFDIPDLSALSGFDPNWGLKTGTLVNWTMTGTGWTGSNDGFGGAATDGLTFKSASKVGTITP